MTFVGAGVGAAWVAALAVGLCESTHCGGNALPGAAVGSVLGALTGAVVGAGFGAMSGRWTPLSANILMNGPAMVPSRSCGPRFELQLGAQQDTRTIGQGGHFSIATSCGRRGIAGFEWGAVSRPTLDSTTTFSDATYGAMNRISSRKVHTTFGGGFFELPLGHSRFHPHLVGSAGVYSVTREFAGVVSQLTPDYAVEYAIQQKYVPENVASTRKQPGVGIGIKSWMAIGPNFALGLGARMHMVGSDASRLLESGVSLAYRP